MPNPPKANRGPSAGPDNRRALIVAAREVFAESGFMAPLSSVARRAGVGQGSLYRHFPDRISLAVAVFDDNLSDLEAVVSDPDSTLDTLFDAIAAQAMVSTALIDMIAAHRHDERAEPLSTRLVAVTETLLAREHAAGRVRPAVTSADVTLAVAMLAFALAKSDPQDLAETSSRARALFHAAFRD